MSAAAVVAPSESDRGPESSGGPGPSIPSCRGGSHRPGLGSLDETARRLSHEELAVATQLAAEGHRVRSQPERRGAGPVADLEVCGAAVEIKSFLSLDDRDGRVPTPRSVCNKLLAARAQAPTTVLYARGSGLDAATAAAGVAEFAARGRPGRTTAIRVVGDGFDLGWGAALARGVPTGRQPGSPSPYRSRRAHDHHAGEIPEHRSRSGPDLGR